MSRFLFPVPSGKHCSLARRTAAAESPRLPCLLPDRVHHHDRLLAAALLGVDPTARLALPSTSTWSPGLYTLCMLSKILKLKIALEVNALQRLLALGCSGGGGGSGWRHLVPVPSLLAG